MDQETIEIIKTMVQAWDALKFKSKDGIGRERSLRGPLSPSRLAWESHQVDVFHRIDIDMVDLLDAFVPEDQQSLPHGPWLEREAGPRS